MSDATAMLEAIGKGDTKAPAALLELVYDELRRLAASKMSRQTSSPSQGAAGMSGTANRWIG